VVSAGLLLGRRALVMTFAFVLCLILAIGYFQQQSHGLLIAPGVSDPTRIQNWVRTAVTFSLFTGVLAVAVMFVVSHIERALDERTAALEQVRREQLQRAQTENALDAAQRTILQMQKLEAVGRLAGGVAHDFNNALVVILGWVDLLRARPPRGQELQEALDAIADAGHRAADLTKQLLAFGGRAVVVPQVVQPQAAIAELTRMLERVLPENIRIQSRIAKDIPAVCVDPSQLHQVLLNLCLNARDAMPRGGTLELSAALISEQQAAGPWVGISVRDTGVGMDRETLDKAFDPFFTTKGALGSGLGLSSVHGIVEQSGGHVRVESVPELGSTFTILLPPADAHALATTPAGLEPRAIAVPSGATVLVVEDDDAVRKLMVAALRNAGYQVIEAESGSAALELARRYRGSIDLLCTDCIMPGISSSQLIADFQVLFPRARVLVCSGHIEEQALRGQIERNHLRYLSKPFTGTELVRVAAETLTAN